jgi:8-oxo-dGTP diphosphatase
MAWVEPAQYWASRPAFHGAAGGLITDRAGQVLLVKPNYVEHSGFPGGAMDAGETPGETAVREIREEVGLAVTLGTLLVVDWVPPIGARTRPLLHFLFDAGFVDDIDAVALQEEELDDARLFAFDEAMARMSPRDAPRLLAAWRARTDVRAALGWR